MRSPGQLFECYPYSVCVGDLKSALKVPARYTTSGQVSISLNKERYEETCSEIDVVGRG